MLFRGLNAETETTETLKEVLDEIDVHDADWRIGNYQILEEIGRGGMGVIYRARQRHSLRIVALKRILNFHSDSRETLARFRREAEAAASLDHPNILPIYEVSESDDGLPFFSMKFAAGGSLQDAARSLRNDPRRIIGLMAKVTRGVHYAHSHGIVHRDLKPGNILLDACGEPMVSDFGLARWLDMSSDLTKTLTIFGTPGYIAPEQTQGVAKKLTPAADIYSIGAVLFDLFTGRTPFLGEHALAVVKQASEKPAPKLRTLSPLADRDVETICAKCLEREPQARYRSAGELAEDLERWLEGRPIIARPVSPPVRIWRWSKRNPKLASSVAATAVLGVLLLAVAVPIASSWLWPKPPPAILEKSIAVLPFENLSADQENAFFADGMQDEILTDLAKVADLKVISRTSVMTYKSRGKRNLREIANALGVAHVVEGSVQRAGNRVRVSAQLIDARTDTHVWAERYDRDLADVFALESDLAEKIVAQLKSTLSPEQKTAIEARPTNDLVAYNDYVHAKTLIANAVFNEPRKEQFFEAVRLLESATARDPSFALAYYELAHAHDQLFYSHFDRTDRRLELANNAIQSLRRLRPDSGEAHLAVAKHLYWGYLDYDQARRELDAAKRLLPNDPLCFLLAGYIDRRQGRWDESVKNVLRASELDPRNYFTLQQLALTYLNLRRYPEMTTALDRAISIAPHDVVLRLQRAEVPLNSRADTEPLRATCEAILAEDPSSIHTIAAWLLYVALYDRNRAEATHALSQMPLDATWGTENVSFPRAWCAGLVAQLNGDESTSMAQFQLARQQVAKALAGHPDDALILCALGMIDAVLGNKDDALREGQRAVELLPLEKDAIDAAVVRQYLAAIYAWSGEKDLALKELRRCVSIPGHLTYGQLRLDSMWEPLGGDARFQRIVASLAPK
jgi:serine/threonine-protein kinase